MVCLASGDLYRHRTSALAGMGLAKALPMERKYQSRILAVGQKSKGRGNKTNEDGLSRMDLLKTSKGVLMWLSIIFIGLACIFNGLTNLNIHKQISELRGSVEYSKSIWSIPAEECQFGWTCLTLINPEELRDMNIEQTKKLNLLASALGYEYTPAQSTTTPEKYQKIDPTNILTVTGHGTWYPVYAPENNHQ